MKQREHTQPIKVNVYSYEHTHSPRAGELEKVTAQEAHRAILTGMGI